MFEPALIKNLKGSAEDSQGESSPEAKKQRKRQGRQNDTDKGAPAKKPRTGVVPKPGRKAADNDAEISGPDSENSDAGEDWLGREPPRWARRGSGGAPIPTHPAGDMLCADLKPETRLPSCYSLRLPSVFLMCSVHCVLLGLDLDGGLARGCCADSVAVGGLNPWLLLGWQLAAGSWELAAGCGCCRHCHCDCCCRHRCCCGCNHCRCRSGLLRGMRK